MSSNHVAPAVRGRRHRRQLARLPSSGSDYPLSAPANVPVDIKARSPGLLGLGNGEDDTNLLDLGLGDLGGGGGAPGFTQSATTIVQSVVLPFTTILETNVATVLVPVKNTPTPTNTPSTPTQQSNTQSQSSSTQTSSSTQSSSSAASSNSSSSATSASSTSSSASSTAANSAVTPPPSSAADNGNSLAGSRTVSSPVTAPASPTSDLSQVSTTSKGLSGGAIGGIVAVCIIAAIIMLVWVVRKLFLRRRAKRRETFVWPQADLGPKPEGDFSEKMFVHTDGANAPPVPEKPNAPKAVPALTPPPMSYNNPGVPATAPLQSPTLTAGAAAVSLSPASAGAATATVRCTYIPNLPDELSVTIGESVHVVNEYDDGWALCRNAYNEQGVVPLECLDRSGAPVRGPGHYLGQGTGDWRMSRRASSLNGAQAAAPIRY